VRGGGRRGGGAAGGIGLTASADAECAQDTAELARLTAYVTDLRRRYDEQFQTGNRKETALQSRVDSLRELELDATKLADGDTPVTQRIRSLEQKLAASAERLEEVLLQRRTYEQVAKRLRDERTGLQPQLHSLERSLAAKTRDLEELIRLAHDAAHDKDSAKAELLQVEERLAVDRQQREKTLSDRQALWRVKQDMAASAVAQREAAAAAVAQHEEEPVASKWNITASSAMGDLSRRASDEDGGMTLDEALRKIKEVTGVSEVDDVIRKFSSQQETTRNLQAMTQEAQARIDGLTARIEATKVALEQHKYSAANAAAAPAAAAAASTRRVLDELEAQLAEANARYERLQQRQERVARLLVSIRAGSDHLAERLESVRCDVPLQPPGSDAAAVALAVCEVKLGHALHEMRDEEQAHLTSLSDPAKLASLSFPTLGEESQAVLNSTLRMDHLSVVDDEDAGDEDDEEDGPEEVLDRSAVKSTAERRITRKQKASQGTAAVSPRKLGAR
jgi:chromosome segregation ATPase